MVLLICVDLFVVCLGLVVVIWSVVALPVWWFSVETCGGFVVSLVF